MGMYTEVFFRAEVDKEAYFIMREASVGVTFERQPHPLFTKPRFSQLFRGGSAYFPAANHFKSEADPWASHPPIRSVSFRANLKNYDGEIQAFFDWVRPHCVTEGFIGYSLYEEADMPTLYFAGDFDA